MANSKPTILLIQGSFQTPQVYSKLTRGLQAQGYPVVHPVLPSLTNSDHPSFPNITLADDAFAIQSELQRLIEEEGKEVFILMHSYGGLVGCEAIPEDLVWKKRQTEGLLGGVLHEFLFSAFLLDENQSILAAFGVSPNDDIQPDGRYIMKNGAVLLYDALPTTEAKHWASLMIPQSYAVQSTVLTRASWKYIPSIHLPDL